MQDTYTHSQAVNQEKKSSPISSEELGITQDLETILGDDHQKLFHFAKWHIEDYMLGTQGMSLEMEGAYMRFLMRLYQRGKPLPDNDRFMMVCMGLSLRVWKRIKSALIAAKKIICKAGYLTNVRFEKERKARAEQLQKQAEGMRERWRKERTSKEVCGKFEESLEKVSSKLSAKVPKKVNEINDSHDSYLSHKEKEIDKEKDNIQPPPIPVAARETCGGGDEIDGLNGATSLIVDKLAKWISPIMPDKRTARASIANFVSLYTSDVVKDAFAELEAKMLHGDIVARPIPYLASACSRLKKKSEQPRQMTWREEQSRVYQALST